MIATSAAVGVAIILTVIEFRNPSSFLYPVHPLAAYENASLTTPAGFVIEPGMHYRILRSEKVVLETGSMFPHTWIRRYVDAHEVESRGRRCWCTENVAAVVQRDALGHAYWVASPRFSPEPTFLVFVLLGIALCLRLFAQSLDRADDIRFLYAFYLSVWGTGILALFYIRGFYFTHNPDYEQWFTMAKEWLRLERSSRLNNTLGPMFFYLPFILLLRPSALYGMIVPYEVFALVVFGGGSFLLVMYIARQVTGSIRALHIAAVVAIAFPFTAWTMRMGTPVDPDFMGKTVLYVGRLHPYAVSLSFQALLTGWHAMGDGPALFFVLLGFAAMVGREPSRAKYTLLGCLLGAAMCMRYTSCLVFPGLFLWDVVGLRRRGCPVKEILVHYLVLGTVAMIAFSPQLLDNLAVMGNPLQPSLPPQQYVGQTERFLDIFDFSSLNGYRFYMQIHYKILLISVFSLYFITDMRVAATLWLSSLFPLLFHCSLMFYDVNATRYLLPVFPMVYLAIAASCSRLSGRQLAFFGAVLLPSMFLASPESPGTYAPIRVPYWAEFAIPVTSAVVGCVLSGRIGVSRASTAVLSVLMLLLTIGQWWIVLVGLCAFPFWCVIRIVDNERERTPRSPSHGT